MILFVALVSFVVLHFGPQCLKAAKTPRPIVLSFDPGTGSYQAVHVADTWQEWLVTYADGSTARFDSRDTEDPTGISLDVTGTREPCTLLVEFKVELRIDLKSGNDGAKWAGGHYWTTTPWQEILRGEPIVTVLVDGRAAASGLSLNPLIFTARENKAGDTKAWKAFIVFSGSPSTPSDATLINVNSALVGKGSALIQVINNQVWILTQLYDPSWITGDPSPLTNERSRKSAVNPYGLSFTWTPAITGPATFTWPTGYVTTGPSGIVLIYTQTGTTTVTLWTYVTVEDGATKTRTVTATLAGPTVTVTETIATNRPTGGTTGGGTATGILAGIEKWLKPWLPEWLQPYWLIVFLLLVFFGLWLLVRLFR